MNTWQDAENIDVTHGYTCYIWIPNEISAIRNLKVKVFVEKYRYYLDLAASEDLGTKSSAASGTASNLIIPMSLSDKWAHTTSDPASAVAAFLAIGTYSSIELSLKTHTHNVVLGSHTHSLHIDVEEDAVHATADLSAILYDPDDVLVHNFGNVVTGGEGSAELDLTSYFKPISKRGLWYINFAIDYDEARLRVLFMMAGIG